MHSRHNPLTAEQLQETLEDYLGLIESEHHATVAAATVTLAHCSRQQQEWVLEWVRTIIRDNVEIAYQFVNYLPQALALLETDALEDWVIKTVEVYDKVGLQAAVAHIQAIESYAQIYRKNRTGLPLSEIHGVLHTFLTGLNGRQLKLASSEITYTDTETLFLPPVLNRFIQREHNFFLYKAIAVHLWAQTWFGTWRYPLTTKIAKFHHRYKAIRLFHTLERLRLDACIARELPGLYRDLGHLLTLFSEKRVPTGWETIGQQLAQPNTSVQDSYQLLEQIYFWSVPTPVCYQGWLLPEPVESVVNSRRCWDKKIFQANLVQLSHNQNAVLTSAPAADIPLVEQKTSIHSDNIGDNHDSHLPTVSNQQTISQSSHFTVEIVSDHHATQTTTTILTLNGQPICPSADLKQVMASILQDDGTIPKEYLLMPAGNSRAGEISTGVISSHSTPTHQNHDYQEFIYPEWDYRRQKYYNNWCFLREVSMPLQSEQFVTETLQRYRGLLKTLRRTFEALRGGDQRLKKQPFGDDIDLEALVTAYADAQSGLEINVPVFTHRYPVVRDIAVMFMVDMSGSTKGWINQAERESLVLLCEVLETLGDRYAIYGFSGTTRKQCEIYPIKHFDEAYNTTVRQRISAITPQAYTRMGAIIRHLTQRFKEIDAKIRLLMTLSDGKPDDEGDNYGGIYGIEDTRQALLEAKREGIQPFCITIDTEAKTYLPRMYGAVNYTVVDQVSHLPLKISDIYKKLTG